MKIRPSFGGKDGKVNCLTKGKAQWLGVDLIRGDSLIIPELSRPLLPPAHWEKASHRRNYQTAHPFEFTEVAGREGKAVL